MAAERPCSGTLATTPVSARWIRGFRSQTIGDTDNVANLREDASSIWNLHHRLLSLRKKMPALSIGLYRPELVDEDLLVYFREFEDTRLLIVLNLTTQAQ